MPVIKGVPRLMKHDAVLTRASKPNSEPKAKTMASQGRVSKNNQALALAKALNNMKGMP